MKCRFSKKLITTIMCFFFMFLFVAIPRWAKAEDTIKIGQVDPFSGPIGQFGNWLYQAIKFAVDEQNAKGGLLGKKIEIIKADSEFKPDVALRKGKKLVLEDKVDFLGIALGSHLTIPLHKVASQHKKILINYGAVSDNVMGKEFSRYAFRLCVNGHQVSSSIAQLLALKPYRRFYLISPDILFGHQTNKAFKEMLKIHIPEAKIVGEDYHPMATKDFGPYITKIVASKADIVYSASFGVDARTMIPQARSLGLKVPFPFALPFAVDPPNINVMKDDAVGIFFTVQYTMRAKTPENEKFIAKWREYHKDDMDPYTMWPAAGVGAVAIMWQMVFAAVERAGSLDSEKIIETLEGFWYKTPVGWWYMRECDHQLIMPMFGGQIQAGSNPWYDGSINPKVKMPWIGKDINVLPALGLGNAIPPTSDYNPRCP